MKMYYINNGNENGGPFTLEELKQQVVVQTTLVWQQGMEDWQYAIDVAELKFLFKQEPNAIPTPAPKLSEQIEKDDKTILGIKINYFFLALLFIAILATTLIFTAIRSTTQKELNVKNKQTELRNEKIKLEQKQSIEQRIQSEIQDNITLQNTNKKRKEEITLRLYELKKLISDDKNHLNQALTDLSETEEYKILRSEKAKEEQIDKIQKDIDSWKKIINQLENESNRLYLELETIH
jgi:hypothetical protein